MTDQRNEIVEHDGGGRAVSIPMDQRMAMLREALTNPDVDPAKAAEMASLIWKMEDREREAEFNRDKIAAIKAMPPIFKRGKSDKHDYAKFEDMYRACMPVLDAHNMTLDFRVGSEGNNITVQPILRHRNGYVEEGGIMKGPPDQGPGRSAVQAVGSTTSYLKRHSFKAILNVIEDDEDDDGRGGALISDSMNNRRVAIVEAAQAAKDAGTYDAYFAGLKPKDRAWMISTGRHAMFGGAPLLPGATPEAERRTVQEKGSAETYRKAGYRDDDAKVVEPSATESKPPATGEQLPLDQDAAGASEATTPKQRKSPREWTDAFKKAVADCGSMQRLDEFMDTQRDNLSRLKGSNEALWKECNDAYRAKIASFLET